MIRPHVHLHPQCGACGDAITLGQKIVAVIRKGRSIQAIDAHTLPDYGAADNAAQDNEWYFCRKTSCSRCINDAAEAATIHADCYNLFRQLCKTSDPLYRLWLAAAWRRPWDGAPSLPLALHTDANRTMQLAATACSLPQLAAVPAEILHIIGTYAEPSPLSRYRTVIDLAADWNGRALSWQPSLPLSNIALWDRDSNAVVEGDPFSIVKITIDCCGLKRIERLMDYPPFANKRSDTEVYIVETQERLGNIRVQFHSGLARLDVPMMTANLQLWDTPAPPPLETLWNMPKVTKIIQFATIDLKKSYGLTFFVAHRSTFAVHNHSDRQPRPDKTFNRLSRQRQRYTSWIYVPFPSKDRLTHFGIRVPQNSFTSSSWAHADYTYLFRFELAGDVMIGPHFTGPTYDVVWPVQQQLLLIFNVTEAAAITAMSAYPNQSSSEIQPFARSKKPPFQDAGFSCAPLEDIAVLHVYSDAESGLCRGMLAEYYNGSQRALGECRIGLDPVCTYEDPAGLCFSRVTRKRPGTIIELKGTKVRIANHSKHEHNGEEWSCFPMQGTLEFWFTNEQSILNVIVDEVTPFSGYL